MVIPLLDDAPKEIKNIPNIMETDPWLEWGLERLETNAGGTPTRFRRGESGELIVCIETEVQSERKPWIDNNYAYPGVPTNARALIHDNDAVVGGTVVIDGTVVIGGAVAVESNAVFSGGLTIRRQIPATRFNIWPVIEEPRGLTRDSEQLTWDKCRQVLSAFTSHAKEVLERKNIEITGTRIRDWHAIDDTNWKQCILDLTIKAESHIALRIWDELSEELKKFINTQPEVFRSFLKDKLSLDIKWV
jgi:hypothetical protein